MAAWHERLGGASPFKVTMFRTSLQHGIAPCQAANRMCNDHAHHIIHWCIQPSMNSNSNSTSPRCLGGGWCSLNDLDLKDCAHLFSSAQHRSRPATVSRGEVHPFPIAQTTPQGHRICIGDLKVRQSGGGSTGHVSCQGGWIEGSRSWSHMYALVSRWVEQHFTSG